MLLRYLPGLYTGSTLNFAPPYPADTGTLGVVLAAFYSDMQPGQVISVSAFAIGNTFADAATRLAYAYVAAQVGQVFEQQSDSTYWTLTALGSPPTFTQAYPVAGGVSSVPVVTRAGAAIVLPATVKTTNIPSGVTTGQYIIFTNPGGGAEGTQITQTGSPNSAALGWTGTSLTTSGITLQLSAAPTNYSSVAQSPGAYQVYYNLSGTMYSAPFTMA